MRGSGPSGGVIQAASLSPLLNSYTIDPGPPKRIVVPRASELPAPMEVTVAGTLLSKQYISLHAKTGKRATKLAANGGAYYVEPGDGDIHFCLGAEPLAPGITCELQGGAPWVGLFNQSRGSAVTVDGLFRCLFEHPGFSPGDDAHIFEVHPVRAVQIAGTPHSFGVAIPDQKSIHTWDKPHPLNQQDSQVKVSYDAPRDTLTFTGMEGEDENYVQVSGGVSAINLVPGGRAPSSFTIDSPQVGHPLEVYCLQGTNAALQLSKLASKKATLVGLRNIDLGQAMKNRYVIDLLGIDIQPA